MKNKKKNDNTLKKTIETLQALKKTNNITAAIYTEIIIFLSLRQQNTKNENEIKTIIEFKEFLKTLINKSIKQKQIKEATKNEKDKTTFKNFKNNNFL